MSNTPKPQANKTIDELVEELFKMGILAGIGKANIDASGAKRLGSQSIKALITEARIDNKVYPTYYLYACPNGTHEFELTEVCNHCLPPTKGEQLDD